jgi:GT2 family glycosyltransferase
MRYAVTIIIINWNGKELIKECLEGMKRQTYQDFTVMVVDNGSTDGSVEYVRKIYPEVNVIALKENYGFAVANNVALKKVETEYVALLNNDVVAHPDWLNSLVAALDAHPEAGSATSKFLYYDRPDVIDRAGDGYSVAGAGVLRGRGRPGMRYDRKEWVFGACGGASIYRTRMFKDIGYFDPNFFIIYEDVDISFRAQLMGYRCLYVPEAVVYHRASHSVVYDSQVSVYYGHRNLEWVYVKNMPLELIIGTFFFHLCYIVISFMFFFIQGHLNVFVKAKKEALKGVKKMLKERRRVQQRKTVSNTYIWRLLDKEYFLPRLLHRLGKQKKI